MSEHEMTDYNFFTNLKPTERINGFDVRPGFYRWNGATALTYGVNFTIHSQEATSCELLLFKREAEEPYAVLPYPDHFRIGEVFSMIVFGLDIEEFEYAYRFDGPYDPKRGLLFDKTKILLDPYAHAVTGRSVWGKDNNRPYHARVVRDIFGWGQSKPPMQETYDLIIYELHVRGFTQHATSGVPETHRGTFAGLYDKIDYLKDLGVTAVELMPVFEFDENAGAREYEGKRLLDYWGYNPVSFFAPNTSYTAEKEYNREGAELKRVIRMLNENGIEVYLDVVFNHTGEGDETGPFFSFKGIDNNVYYMLSPEGEYYNFSGCGNTLNCNNPIVQNMILESLRYWVATYHVDGFRFDLASILGRNEDGSPMEQPPLLKALAFDPLLSGVKLIAEAWDAGGLYQVGSFPSWNRWAEWNGKYRDDLRSFLKGDEGFAASAALRITGSTDLYPETEKGNFRSVNFITCHDGFTLADIYSYNEKHNMENGWDNTDGSDDNRSWNCGIEGPTDDPSIRELRRKLRKNAFAVLMFSRGVPMFLAGDEFGNSQNGNNNVYCQDNETAWLNWEDLIKNRDFYEFCRSMIALRKQHDPVRTDTERISFGFPSISLHNGRAWDEEFHPESHFVGVMFAGKTNGCDDCVFLAVNAYWKEITVELPALPEGYGWKLEVDTARPDSLVSDYDSEAYLTADGSACSVCRIKIGPRSVRVYTLA